MEINIGGTIAKFRKERSLTQEQLSEVFGVSIAAVSKWETGISYPDIELLPVIANFFDISVDCLLGYDMSKTTLNMDEHLKIADDLFHTKGKEMEAISYLGNLAYRFPNNVKILVKYAEYKINYAAWNPEKGVHKKLYEEAESILRSINTNGLTRNEHDSILKALYGLYLWEKSYDKAEEMLTQLTPDNDLWDIDGAKFWLLVHKGEMEKSEGKYYALVEKALINERLIYGSYHIFYDAPEKLIKLNTKLIDALQLFSDYFSSIPYAQLSFLHECNAFMYAKLEKKEEVIHELKKIIQVYSKISDSYEPFKNLINRNPEDEPYYIFINEAFSKIKFGV